MSMAEPGMIDIVANDRQTGKLLLVMTKHRPWNGKSMFDEFRAKLESYVGYALSDQFRSDHPDRKPGDVIIKLDCACPPDAAMRECFGEVPSKLKKFGIGFVYEVFDDADNQPVARPWWKFW